MKRQIITIIIALVAMTAGAQETNQEAQKKERTIALWGHVKNSLTRVGIKDVFITLMREDSAVVDTMHVFQQWSGRGKDDFAYRFNIPAREQQYIIRAEHPDYETTYVDYHVRHIARNTYFDAPWHYMKKRSRMTEDIHQLGEVVVRATKIKMTYRGDTITFNADAFNLPEGSMLDALIRQMDGVELKDDGRIEVTTATYGLYSVDFTLEESIPVTLGLMAKGNQGNTWCFLSDVRLTYLEGLATGVKEIVPQSNTVYVGTVYDLQGRKVNDAKERGIYIKNGRKIVVK